MDTTPTGILEQEHRYIEKIVGVLPPLASLLEVGRPLQAEMLRDIVEFMQSYADRCHHGKEETHLFPLLVERGVPDKGCPVGALTQEHVAGRSLVSDLSHAVESYASGDPSVGGSLAAALRGVAGLYPNHIWKEDFLLFPMTNKVLGLDDQQELLRMFAQVDADFGLATRLRLEQLATDLPGLVARMGGEAT
jgi:hemerythrin-like domain-containing protein